MHNRVFLYAINTVFLSSMVLIGSCGEGNSGSMFPQGLNSITVLVRNNVAYPIYQFSCSNVEASGVNESCPDGFGCDAQHYHGGVISIGTLGPNGAADVIVGIIPAPGDPDQCLCGWGKVTEAEVRTVNIFKNDVEDFGSFIGLQTNDNLTLAQQLSVDPCGG